MHGVSTFSPPCWLFFLPSRSVILTSSPYAWWPSCIIICTLFSLPCVLWLNDYIAKNMLFLLWNMYSNLKLLGGVCLHVHGGVCLCVCTCVYVCAHVCVHVFIISLSSQINLFFLFYSTFNLFRFWPALMMPFFPVCGYFQYRKLVAWDFSGIRLKTLLPLYFILLINNIISFSINWIWSIQYFLNQTIFLPTI